MKAMMDKKREDEKISVRHEGHLQKSKKGNAINGNQKRPPLREPLLHFLLQFIFKD